MIEDDKKQHRSEKTELHPRNKHRDRYDFKALTAIYADLKPFVHNNAYNDTSIDFSDAQAVLALNKALLKLYYDIDNYTLPEGFLCAPVPGRADYVHYAADVLATSNNGVLPAGSHIKCLDVGVGANCIYPIIGIKEYGWSFVGCDVEPIALENANLLKSSHPNLASHLDLRLQTNNRKLFTDVITEGELFDLTICNPPFHATKQDAAKGNIRKISSLRGERKHAVELNFGGQSNELHYPGGEEKFVKRMITESKLYAKQCFWFTTLISKKDSLQNVYKMLKKVESAEVKTITMSQGTKVSRFVAWTFLDADQQVEWVQRWKTE